MTAVVKTREKYTTKHKFEICAETEMKNKRKQRQEAGDCHRRHSQKIEVSRTDENPPTGLFREPEHQSLSL